MHSPIKKALHAGSALVLATVLSLGAAIAAHADDAPAPAPDTSASAPATTPTPEPTATQSAEPAAPAADTSNTDAKSAPADDASKAPEPVPTSTATPTDESTKPAVAAKVTTNGGYDPPTAKACTPGDASNVTWTRDAHLSTATVTLKSQFATCDVTLHTFGTEGPTWETSGVQTFNDYAGFTLTTENPTKTLTVVPKGCNQQQDLATGSLTKYDGQTAPGHGPVPHYPDVSTPTGLIDHWNGAVDCTPPPKTPKVCPATATSPTATNLNPLGWNSHDTRTTGVSEFVNGGYHLQTTDTANPGSSQNKATLYKTVTPTPLSEFGEPSVTFADGGTGVKPGMQVGIDVDGNGTFDGYLVGEPWTYGQHNWWINKPGFNVPSGMGYTSFGSWADFVAANPAAMVVEVGFSLGSGVLGDWVIKDFTYDCTSHTYDYVAPPVVVAPSATIVSLCSAQGGTDVSIHLEAGTSDHTFQILVGGVQVDEETVKAGGSFDYNTTLDEDSYGGSTTVQVKSGETAVTDVVTVSTDCLPPVTIIATPPAPKVVGPTCKDDGSLPTLVDGDGYTAKYDRPFDGPGVYTATYTVTGDNTAFATGKSVSYDLTVKGKTGDCPVPPSHNGGANTGLNGTQPGMSSTFWNAGNSSFFGGGAFLFIVAFIAAVVLIRRRNRNNGEVGVEAQ